MKELLLAIVKEMVDHPDQVTVNEFDGESRVILELSVAKQDLGKVIGKKGKNITAIRTLIQASSVKQRKRAVVELVE